MKKNNVLFISTSYPRNDKDWRGRFIADMISSLSVCKTVSLKTFVPPGSLPQRVTDAALPNESLFLNQVMEKGGIAHLFRSRKIAGFIYVCRLMKHLRSVYRREFQTDVMHINWLQNAIPLLGTDTPAVVSVLGTDFKLLDLPGMKSLLQKVFQQRKCIIAPNAHWMKECLEEHFGEIAEIRPIPFGVQDRWFGVRRILEESRLKCWITVSRLTENKMGPLFEWSDGLFNDENRLHLLGPNQEHLRIPEWISYEGATNPHDLMDHWFPRAYGLITLSRHDEGRPQVILEAMASGIPVIASDLAAHRDVIEHGETGWIVKSRDEFSKAVRWLSEGQNSIQMGMAANAWVTKNIGTWDDCARRYVAAYADLTEGEHG